MTRQELKTIIKDTLQYSNEGCLNDEYLTITTNDKTYSINQFENEIEGNKIKLNNIQVATFKNGFAHSVYLKNGLESYRIAKRNKLI